jgi:hypothetical protein
MDLDTLIAQTVALSWDDPASLTSEDQPISNLGLFGFSITPKLQNINMVKDALKKAWSFAIPFRTVAYARNKFIFTFTKPDHVSRILQQVTWNVNGSLLILKQWSPDLSLGEIQFTMAPFWVQAHGLPLKNMNLKNAVAIGKGLGNLLKVDHAESLGSIFRSYLRILVEIDIYKPLKAGFSIKRADNPPPPPTGSN